jgi:hypothetical protein
MHDGCRVDLFLRLSLRLETVSSASPAALLVRGRLRRREARRQLCAERREGPADERADRDRGGWKGRRLVPVLVALTVRFDGTETGGRGAVVEKRFFWPLPESTCDCWTAPAPSRIGEGGCSPATIEAARLFRRCRRSGSASTPCIGKIPSTSIPLSFAAVLVSLRPSTAVLVEAEDEGAPFSFLIVRLSRPTALSSPFNAAFESGSTSFTDLFESCAGCRAILRGGFVLEDKVFDGEPARGGGKGWEREFEASEGAAGA